MSNIKGVDISYCQKGLSYDKLAEEGVKFAIIRACYSTSVDNLLETHVKGCVSKGIKYGFYVYSMATTKEQAIAEADACIKAIEKFDYPDYPIFFDLEDNNIAEDIPNSVKTDCAIAFCERLKDNGYYSGIYTNPAWLESYYEKSRLVGKYDIWLAHWTEDPKYPSKYDYGQTMWQWGIDNIGMNIDGDICFIDYPAKIKLYKEAFYSGKTEKDDKKDNSTGVNDTSNKDKPGSTSNKNESGDTKYPVGTELTLNKTNIYVSSSASEAAGVLSGKYFILSSSIINNRIRITTPKGNTVCTGWVNTSDVDSIIGSTSSENTHNGGNHNTKPSSGTSSDSKNVSTEDISGKDKIKYPVGTELTLNKTNIYVSSSVSEPSGVLSGKYFILSSSIINKRIRITTPKGNTVCTGWINTSDADKCISTSEAKNNATGTSSTVKATNKHLSRQELDLVATRVIRGEYGNGTTRRRLLAAAGYDYDEVMARVNEIYSK